MANGIRMSHREIIQQLHAQGFSNREIARRLELHRDTVNRHVRLLNAKTSQRCPPGISGKNNVLSGRSPFPQAKTTATRYSSGRSGRPAGRCWADVPDGPPQTEVGPPGAILLRQAAESCRGRLTNPLRRFRGAEISRSP